MGLFSKKEKFVLPYQMTNRPLLISENFADFLINASIQGVDLKNFADSNQKKDSVNQNNIAVIPVVGPLSNKACYSFFCSNISYELIREWFNEALEDESIGTIIFDIDSPGGEAEGVFDLADEIYQARDKKNIIAIANEGALSAAYAIGSSASKLYLTRTAIVGSIGVISLHLDQSEYNKKQGVNITPIYAGSHKNDFSPYQKLSKQAYKRALDEINIFYNLFCETVARNRGLTKQEIQKTEALTYLGNDAIKAGLADEIITYTGLIQNFKNIQTTGGNIMSKQKKNKKDAIDIDLKNIKVEDAVKIIEACNEAGHPELAKGFIEKGASIDEVKKAIEENQAAEDKNTMSKDDAVEIINLCSLAGKIKLAQDFIEKETSIDDVKKTLLELQAKEAEQEKITSTIKPDSKGDENPLLKNAQERAKK